MERKERMLEDGKSRSRSQLKGEEEGWEWRSEDQGWKEDQPSYRGRSGSRAESPQPLHLQPQDDNLLAEQILKTFSNLIQQILKFEKSKLLTVDSNSTPFFYHFFRLVCKNN